MAGPNRSQDGQAGQLGRLATGVLLAAAVAVLVFLAAGGAGPGGQEPAVLLLGLAIVIGVGGLFVAMSRRARPVGAAPPPTGRFPARPPIGRHGLGTRAPGTGRARSRAATWGSSTAPEAGRGAIWGTGAAPGGTAARPPSAPPAAGRRPPDAGARASLPAPRRPWVVVGLGILAVVLAVAAIAVGVGSDASEEEAIRAFAAVSLLAAAPCLVAGMIAARRVGGQLATWIELGTGVVLGSVGVSILAAMSVDQEAAGYVLVGMLTLVGLVGTAAFVAGSFLWGLAAGSPRAARPAGQPRR